MQRIVINKCYGGFGLSPKAVARWAELQGRQCYFYETLNRSLDSDLILVSEVGNWIWWAADTDDVEAVNKAMKADDRDWFEQHIFEHNRYADRSDPYLVQAVEELGDEANGPHAELKIVEIPDGVEFSIEEYDGVEWVAETHRVWR